MKRPAQEVRLLIAVIAAIFSLAWPVCAQDGNPPPDPGASTPNKSAVPGRPKTPFRAPLRGRPRKLTAGQAGATPLPAPTATMPEADPTEALAPEVSPEGGEEEASPQSELGEGEELVSLDLDNVDIKFVIKLISDFTGKDYILSDQVRGNVTVFSPTKIPIDALPSVLQSLLEVRGLATVPAGELIKIVPRRDAAKGPIDFVTEEQLKEESPDDRVVTQIITLQYADMNEVQRLVQTLANQNASVIAYAPTNMLIVSDSISNLDRIMKIVNEVDIPALESTITVVPCRYAAASLLAEEILTIVQQKGAAAPRPAPRRRGARTAPQAAAGEEAIKIFADERTNALIIVASPEDTERVLALVEELDRQTPESTTRVRVKRRSYSDSDDVASVLQSLTAARTGEGVSPITVTSYPEINAIIIDASPQDYDLLTKIIDDLDIPRDQVMVEVIVTEVDLGRSLSVEFQAQTLNGLDFSPDKNSQKGWDNTQNFGGTEFEPALRQLIIDDLDKGYPLSAGGGFNAGFVYSPESDKNFIGPISTLLNALEADTDINVLSAPQVLTSDNEEVVLEVADKIPILTSTLTQGAGTTGTDTIQQIDYRDVGVKIKLTPHISKDRFVRIELDQSIEQLVGVSLADIQGPLTPATLKRATSTVVNVKDGHTVVISGMISDSYTTQESKVPILGDIPIVGLLARYRKNSLSKINLMIFITPHIVRNPTELAMVTQKTRERGGEFLEEAHGRPPRMLDKFIEAVKDEAVKKMPPTGEAGHPYGLGQ